jgi:hypothetical protein
MIVTDNALAVCNFVGGTWQIHIGMCLSSYFVWFFYLTKPDEEEIIEETE